MHTVTNMYKERGFNIDIYHGDNEFNINDLKECIRPASLNIYAKEQHITIIEIKIQAIKQGERFDIHSVPYKRYTRLIKISLVECIIHSRKYFPQNVRIRKRLGANTILLEKPNPDFDMKIVLVYYNMMYTGTTNTLNHISIPSIDIRESNKDGGHFFMSRYT